MEGDHVRTEGPAAPRRLAEGSPSGNRTNAVDSNDGGAHGTSPKVDFSPNCHRNQARARHDRGSRAEHATAALAFTPSPTGHAPSPHLYTHANPRGRRLS